MLGIRVRTINFRFDPFHCHHYQRYHLWNVQCFYLQHIWYGMREKRPRTNECVVDGYLERYLEHLTLLVGKLSTILPSIVDKNICSSYSFLSIFFIQPQWVFDLCYSPSRTLLVIGYTYLCSVLYFKHLYCTFSV